MQRLRLISLAALTAITLAGCQTNPLKGRCPDGRCGLGGEGAGSAGYRAAADEANSVQPASYTSGASSPAGRQ